MSKALHVNKCGVVKVGLRKKKLMLSTLTDYLFPPVLCEMLNLNRWNTFLLEGR